MYLLVVCAIRILTIFVVAYITEEAAATVISVRNFFMGSTLENCIASFVSYSNCLSSKPDDSTQCRRSLFEWLKKRYALHHFWYWTKSSHVMFLPKEQWRFQHFYWTLLVLLKFPNEAAFCTENILAFVTFGWFDNDGV